ncbi:hypothetical protein Ga0123462_1013 [Mariprofundus ferrinatatus]|uniref:MetA-pathway of phenol degradation n=1 Tax=Mariprofundus ferrinatatus TaxID=1921087 RepID=A0A2K8L447_9PROT|nr:TorF family putative porin [Mariprofundus ferrinatatus]ATX81882.1 hypothetical protein Ga0123462_1013 [Mariprofundus ferrinatatus]
MKSKKNIVSTVAALMLLGAGSVSTAQAEDLPIAGDIGVYSQYMWRGMQASPSASVQGDLGVESDFGLSANVWFAAPLGNAANGNNTTEFDFTVDYSTEFGGVGVSVGYIYYLYQNASSLNTGELYAGLSYGPVSATYYYAVNANKNGWKKDAYVDLGLSHSYGGFDMGANFGFYLPSNDVNNPTAFPTTKNELGHIDLSLSKDVELGGGVTMTPSLLVSVPTYTGKPNGASQFVAGVNFAY